MATNLQEAGLILTAQGADEFKSAMKGISAATKEAYSELKLAQSQYDKNTSATKKLADRQQYLQKMTEEYTKKEQILRAELAQMENAEERDEAAIAKKRTEINNCKASLNKYEDALKDVTKQIQSHSAQLKEWGDKLQSVGGKMKDIGGTLTKSVTAPIMGVGAASVVAWKEVDEGLDTVAIKTGATGEALQDMQDRTRNIAKTMPTDFATAGAAIGEVNTRFGLTGDELEELSRQFIKFADINGTDVSNSIDVVQSAMAAFGLEAEDAADVLDILNKAGQDTGVPLDKLASSLTTNGTALKEMGFGINESVGFLANLDKSGVDASSVMTGLKKALQSATKDGKTMGEAMSELQEKMAGAGSDTEAAQYAMELFGAKAGPAIAQAVADGRLSFDELSASVTDWGDSVSSTFESVQDPLDQMTPILNTLKDTGAQLVTDLGPAIVAVLGAISDGVSALNEWWSGLDEKQKAVILTFAGLLAALGPVLSVVGSVISTIGSLVTIMGAASAGGGVMAAVIGALTGPIGIAIAAIAGLIAIGTALYLNWDTICQWAATMKEKVVTAWENLKTDVGTTVENIKSTVTQKFEDIKNKIQEKIESARDKVHDAIEKIKGFFDFEWSLPHIKLPHFSVEGEFSLNPPSIPHFDVDWYKTGGVFDAPSVIGVGEAGPEAVLPLETLWKKLDEIADRIIQSGDRHAAEMYEALIEALGEMSFIISDREFARLLRKFGAIK